ncbi:MAG: OmpA family protein [Pseudomonadota bacterium]
MKANHLLILVACAGFAGACATTVPQELVSAREAYWHASNSAAARVAPAELHIAQKALTHAEASFDKNPKSFQTRDLAYVAQRKAQLAEATASVTIEKENQVRANSAFQDTQGRIMDETKADLNRSRTDLAASEASGDVTAARLVAEKAARVAAEKRAADAMAALAKLAAVKDEPRGTVITLSGSVLFASNQRTLLPEAKERLDQVAAVLLTTQERRITVEGHTDSQGSDSFNRELSQGRADAVRDYIVTRGYEGDLVKANGMGEGHPVADNGSPEGRANNRRVEIIIERAPSTVSQ